MESEKKGTTFKEIARKKQASFFEENYGIHEFDTIKRRLKNRPEPVEIYVESLLKWQDAMDGKIFYEGFRSQIMEAN